MASKGAGRFERVNGLVSGEAADPDDRRTGGRVDDRLDRVARLAPIDEDHFVARGVEIPADLQDRPRQTMQLWTRHARMEQDDLWASGHVRIKQKWRMKVEHVALDAAR